LRQLIQVVYRPVGDPSDARQVGMHGRHVSLHDEGRHHERRPMPSARRRP
jgi:hypothetical protein